MTTVSTPNIGLNIIGRGTSNWGDLVNLNTDKIDNEINKLKTKTVSDRVAKVWEIKNGTDAIYSTPIVSQISNGTYVVIYGCYDGFLYVRNFLTGTLIFKHDCASEIYGRCQAVTGSDGKLLIFVGSHSGKIICVNEDNVLKWEHLNLYDREGTGTVTSAGSYYFIDSTKNWVTNSFIRGNTAGFNASVSIVSGTGSPQTREISGVDATDHTKIWLFQDWTTPPDSTSVYEIIPKYPSDKYYQHAGTVYKESDNKWYLYSTSFDGQCTKLDCETGSLIFKFSAKENNEPFPVVENIFGTDIQCVFGSIDKNIYCLSSSGTLLWSTTLDGGIDSFPSCYDVDGDLKKEIISNSRAGYCYILNGETGEIKSKSTHISSALSQEINTRPTVMNLFSDTYSNLVFGTYIGYLYCLDGRDANTVWRFNQGTTMRGSTSMITVNGSKYIISPDMTGCLSVLNEYGQEQGQIHVKGSVEGTPLCGNLINDGAIYILTTSTDGMVNLFKFS